VGPYRKRFPYSRSYAPRQTIDAELDAAKGPCFYLCGVTKRWEWNIHIVGQYEPESTVTHDDERIRVEVVGLKRLVIDAQFTPEAPEEFNSCRNWQFSWQAFPDTPRQSV
jgi:hypothetical protein